MKAAMKPIRFLLHPLPLLIAAVLAVASPWATAVPDHPASPRVTVTWTNPAAFSDARYDQGFSRRNPEQWLGTLARYVQQRAARRLAPGQHLAVTFTDVQRAGIHEPWRGPLWSDVRIVKDPYAPSIDLRFTLTDANGKVLDEGRRTLRDLAFLHRGGRLGDDPLHFEKRLLDDWLQREFPTVQARHG